MSERIEAMDQITQNMDREFKSSRVVRFAIVLRTLSGKRVGLSNIHLKRLVILARSFIKIFCLIFFFQLCQGYSFS